MIEKCLWEKKTTLVATGDDCEASALTTEPPGPVLVEATRMPIYWVQSQHSTSFFFFFV